MSLQLAEYFSNPSSRVVKKEQLEKEQLKIDKEISKSADESSTNTLYTGWASKFYYNYLLVDKASSNVSLKESFLYNYDLRPVESERRVWSWFNYFYFWVADSINLGSFQVAANGLQMGLNWWQCWLTVWFGYSFLAVLVTLVSKMGSNYHISFPITIRASFGIFFSLWPIINRVLMAVIWYAAQCFISVGPISIMLKAIFGTDVDTKMPTTINDPNLTSYQFLCFMIFWCISLPFLIVAPQNLRHLFTAKAAMVPFAAFGMLIWVLSKSGGKIELGSLNDFEIHGSEFSWVFIRSIMGCIGNFATLIINVPDITRFSKTRKSSLWVQVVSIPMLFSLTSLIGILTNAAGYKVFAVNYWSPIDVLEKLLEANYSASSRAGAFFIAFIFTIAQLGTNISANSLSAGTDMTALLPKFIDIKRGSVICALLALCICPWKFMSSSSKFRDALSVYAIFLSSIAGVAVADYYVVRRGYLKLIHLYSVNEKSFYMYGNKFGINFRALVAYICGLVPNIPGFIATVADDVHVSEGAIKLYYLNYWVGFSLSFVIYLVMCHFFPVKGSPVKHIFTEKGWYERWAYVENFEGEWYTHIENPELLDDNISLKDEDLHSR
ncbi:uracil permease Ecym_3603 [Eremothecium cymbalariae DBVPG|uniref:Uracil permease n=1 Tax=Eremothecium cymbalariae (strain CBS 270.75 / DBVPG 7215 / KCTC 17166 / NRRL Y-17582) TaxID=931890 RepID=G8JQT2_ERECY|nr:Hypothetical protein Ecym_3603 [Eremothecium cymbalariae DBVPG\